MMVEEYVCTYGLDASSIRFGVIAGPWQMGKVDQGFLTYWLAAHLPIKKPLKYFGLEEMANRYAEYCTLKMQWNLLLELWLKHISIAYTRLLVV